MVLFLSQKQQVVRNPAMAFVIGNEMTDFRTSFQWFQESLRSWKCFLGRWGTRGTAVGLESKSTGDLPLGSWGSAEHGQARGQLLCGGNSASRTRWLGDLGGLSSYWKSEDWGSGHTFSVAEEVTGGLTCGLWRTELPLLAQSTSSSRSRWEHRLN